MRTTRDKRREVKTLIHSLGLVQAKHAALVPDLLADVEELESRLERLTKALRHAELYIGGECDPDDSEPLVLKDIREALEDRP